LKIILDDTRNFPKSGYNCCRTFEDCILLIDVFKDDLEFISLDYHLSTKKTGFDVLLHMKENNIYPRHINIHSSHVLGVPKMKEYAELNFTKSKISLNPLIE